MPIKVRCQDCGAVMGAPDRAAGKAIKCKGCGARVRVPAARGGKSPGAKKKKKKRRPAPEPSFDDFGSDYDDPFGGMPLRSIEDEQQTVCPKCASPVGEEDIECPNCGVNIETGVLSESQRLRRARKGPPPEEFYGRLLGDSFEFTKNHLSWVFRTGLNWGFSLAMVTLAVFVLAWYIPARERELIESAEGPVKITADYVLIQPGENQTAVYDGVRYTPGSTRLKDGRLVLPPPRIAAVNSPPSYFWGFVASVFFLGCTGWAWTLTDEIVRLTMSGKKKIKRFHTDIYKNMMKGFITIFWPVVLMSPLSWIPGTLAALKVSPIVCGILGAAVFLIPYLFFLPIAVVHMSQPYTYRAWLINWVCRDFFKTLAPAMFVSMLFFFLVLLLPMGLAGGTAAVSRQLSNLYTANIERSVIGGMFGDFDPSSSWQFAFGRMPLVLLVSFMAFTLVSMIVAFPAVMMMRVFGLFGLYFRPDMALCLEQPPLLNAGFGPRYLAYLIDQVITGLIAVAGVVVALIVSKLFGYLYASDTAENLVFLIAFAVCVLGAVLFYFSKWESGSGRATLGKWSIGLIVIREDNSPLDMNHAVKRTLAASLNLISFYIPFTMCAFRSDHRAGHDLMTKTKVVWRGDEDM